MEVEERTEIEKEAMMFHLFTKKHCTSTCIRKTELIIKMLVHCL